MYLTLGGLGKPPAPDAVYGLNPISGASPNAKRGFMGKKQINDPKVTLNFLIWVGGVFMLLLFALLAHFVWRVL